MVKAIAFTAIMILAAGSVASGQIDVQWQNWNLGLTNNIVQSGGTGNASTIQGLGTLNIQTVGINPDDNGDPLANATQGIGAILFQTGSTNTQGAKASLVQLAGVQGVSTVEVAGQLLPAGQYQKVGDLAGATLQHQGALATGGQTLTKEGGSAADVEGLNIVGFAMGQSGTNTCADGLQVSVILGGSFSELHGTPQALGTIATTAVAQVEQLQVANP